ncbi:MULTISPECIES: hypothetical protein [unclassified Moorena]|uniref:hypothetical protein n=1 Tax=unclassified Moorena TaxID=2683338 RepID=UPI00140118FC|nr:MULTISPECIES: hypothetical protein [unclassified Moorena]NEO13283.1 hypothetical protein [Moorena sp. SIO3E8]NEQ02467.1 hypothetical protein [Moorena sp. SIO3F7]
MIISILDSRFPIPDSRFPVPCSLFPVPFKICEYSRSRHRQSPNFRKKKKAGK